MSIDFSTDSDLCSYVSWMNEGETSSYSAGRAYTLTDVYGVSPCGTDVARAYREGTPVSMDLALRLSWPFRLWLLDNGRVLDELPAHWALGPFGMEVARVLEGEKLAEQIHDCTELIPLVDGLTKMIIVATTSDRHIQCQALAAAAGLAVHHEAWNDSLLTHSSTPQFSSSTLSSSTPL